LDDVREIDFNGLPIYFVGLSKKERTLAAESHRNTKNN
jgi:hypothetical protein